MPKPPIEPGEHGSESLIHVPAPPDGKWDRVDPLPCCTSDSEYQNRVFEPYSDERDRIMGALIDDQTGGSLRIANRMATCCRSPILLRDSESITMRLSERRCKSRCCPRCRLFRAREIQYRLMQACRQMDARRFLTLTIVSTSEPLADRLKFLRESFARIRRHAYWKAKVTGGVYCIEVTWNDEIQMWHPHLHAIIDGQYVHKPKLIDAWREATAGSDQIDIQAVESASKCASYVAKYASKSDDARKLPTYMIAEWAKSIHGLRMVHSFGNLHGVQLVEKPESDGKVSIEVVNPSTLAAAAHQGDLIAARILDAIDRAAAGAPMEDHQITLSRVELWLKWKRIEARSRPGILPPPDQPPQGILF